jgi:hypothetical protein
VKIQDLLLILVIPPSQREPSPEFLAYKERIKLKRQRAIYIRNEYIRLYQFHRPNCRPTRKQFLNEVNVPSYLSISQSHN